MGFRRAALRVCVAAGAATLTEGALAASPPSPGARGTTSLRAILASGTEASSLSSGRRSPLCSLRVGDSAVALSAPSLGRPPRLLGKCCL